MARLAAIDIGSNAVRLRIVEVDPPTSTADGPRFSPFRDVFVERSPVRLGHDVFIKGRLERTIIGAACETLRRFRAAMDGAKVDGYRAVATSAAREAQNADVFVERAEREAGVHVELIEGVEEGRLVALAVAERVELKDQSAVLVDVGGGSTELTLLRRAEGSGGRPVVHFSRSLPVGTVRTIESFLEAAKPVDQVHRRLLVEYVARVLGGPLEIIKTLSGGKPDVLIGSGGNIETLAELCPTSSPFPGQGAIDVGRMSVLLDDLCELTADERATRYGLRPDRADTIVPAIAILSRLAVDLGQTRIASPGVGLKEGVLLDLARRHYLPEDFPEATRALGEECLRLGRRFHFDEPHGKLVARFAGILFDALQSVHGLSPRDRILLHAAALLHDVGDYIRYEGHHKHSFYIISNSDVLGMSPTERMVVANVARYHRKSLPTLEHENYRTLSRDDRSKVKALAAIVRIADALDREHRNKVTDITPRIEGRTLSLALTGSSDRELEEWTVMAKAGLLQEELGLDVKLTDATAAANHEARANTTAKIPT